MPTTSSPLRRRLPRQLRHEAGRYLAIFLLLLSVTALGSGFLSTTASLKALTAGMASRYQVEDARVTTTAPLSGPQREAITQAGLQPHELTSVDAPLTLPDGHLAQDQDPAKEVTLRLSRTRTEVNLAALHRGRLPEAADELALDDTFATSHRLRPGDSLEVGSLPFKVVGIVTLPDYAALFRSNTGLIMDTLTFAVGTVSPSGWERLGQAQGTTTAYTQALTLEPQAAADAVSRTGLDGKTLTDGDGVLSPAERHDLELDAAHRLVALGAEVSSLVDAEDNLGIRYAANDLDSDSAFVIYLLAVIIAVIAFVLVVTTSASIEAEGSMIGTLLASGWRKGELVRHYLTLPAAVGVVACALGNVVGYAWMSLPMRGLYYRSYSLPPYETRFSWTALLLSTVLPLGLLLLITLLGLAGAMRRTPLQFLRHEHRRRSHRVVPLPARLPFRTRFRLRLFLRSLPTLASLLVGVALSSFLLLSGLVMLPMMHQLVDDTVAAMPATHTYVLTAPVGLEGTSTPASAAAGAERARLASLSVERRWGTGPMDIEVLGLPQGTRHPPGMDMSPGHVTIGVGLAHKTGVQAGGTLHLTNRFTGQEYQLHVDQVRDAPSDTRAYLPRADLNALLGQEPDSWNAYLSDQPLHLPEGAVARELGPEDITTVAEQMTASASGVMHWLRGLAVIVFLLVVHLLTRTVIDRGSRTISLLKVLGYQDREVSSLYVRTITVTVVGSLLACPPLIITGIRLLYTRAMMRYDADLEVQVPATTVALEIGVSLAAYALVALLHLRRVRRVPLSEALKVQE